MSPLHPQVARFLQAVNDASVPSADGLSIEQLRAGFASMSDLSLRPRPPVPGHDRVVDGPAGGIELRVYRPPTDGPLPIVVYFHGGGWNIGGVDTHDGTCQQLAAGTPAVVVSVGYRLAPEHPFPAAVEDAHFATAWASSHAEEMGADPGRLAVAGDSAGGNLAAVVARRARDGGGPPVKFQLLLYPATDLTASHRSHEENRRGYLLTSALMALFVGSYLHGVEPTHPDASPLFAEDLAGLPPAHVVTAEFDPLRDEGEAYARRLADAGVECTWARYAGTIHYFLGLDSLFDDSRRALAETISRLRSGLGPDGS